MPRFLDSPIWYTETGNQTRGVVSVSTSALNLTPEIQEGGLNVSLIIPPPDLPNVTTGWNFGVVINRASLIVMGLFGPVVTGAPTGFTTKYTPLWKTTSTVNQADLVFFYKF